MEKVTLTLAGAHAPSWLDMRAVTHAGLCSVLGREHATVAEWLKEGCPVMLPASTTSPAIFDVADVVRWLENRAAAAATLDARERARTAAKLHPVVIEIDGTGLTAKVSPEGVDALRAALARTQA